MKLKFCLFFLILILSAYAQEPQYGLKFNSNGYEPEMRTSLDLSPEGFFSFPEGFSMRFDMKIDLKEIHPYGYIFRIIDKTGNNIDFLVGNKDLLSFSFSIGEVVINKTFDEIPFYSGQWLPVQLRIDVKKEELEIQVGEASQKEA
ncbi:hypothetical protein FACS1894145_7510 [Bacteroidia bacterium]|nr:hypothetical protein FACS1894145_7510 [Bacteroidia bacterium]